MTADGTDDDLINLEGHNGHYTFMDADDGKEPRDDVQPCAPADEAHPEGSSDEDDEEVTESADTGRVRRSDGLAMLDDDDDLGAGETTLPLECPPGFALSRSAPPALDSSLVKRHIMLRRGFGWVKGFITRRAQARTRQNYDYRVLIERTGATIIMKLPLGKYIALDDAAAEGARVLLKKSNALSTMLQRELLAAPQGAGRGDIDGDGGTDCGKEVNEEGENGDEEGRKESGAGGQDGGIEGSGLEEDSISASDSGDGEGADEERERNDDVEGRKDSDGSGVDGDNDNDLGKSSFCDSSDSEVEGEGGEEVPDAIGGTRHSRKGKGRKRKRSNSGAEHVSSGPVPTSKSTRGRARTPNVRMRDKLAGVESIEVFI